MVDVHIPDNFLSNVLKIGIMIVVVIMVANFLKPSLTGSYIKDIELLNESIEGCNDIIDAQNREMAVLNDTVALLMDDLQNLTGELDECVETRDVVTADHSKLKLQHNKTVEEYQTIKADYDSFAKQLNDTNNAYEELAQNSADRICCVRNLLEGKEFDSYKVDSDFDIVCTIGGELEIDCS